MFDGNRVVTLVDIDSVVNHETGDRIKVVSHGTKLVAFIDLVGVNTLQIGQAQDVDLAYSVRIPRIHYNYEKYCFFNNQLFEIIKPTKAKEPTDMLLNVAKLEDKEIEDAVRDWLKGGSNGSC